MTKDLNSSIIEQQRLQQKSNTLTQQLEEAEEINRNFEKEMSRYEMSMIDCLLRCKKREKQKQEFLAASKATSDRLVQELSSVNEQLENFKKTRVGSDNQKVTVETKNADLAIVASQCRPILSRKRFSPQACWTAPNQAKGRNRKSHQRAFANYTK